MLTVEEIKESKIWIGYNPKLNEKVQKRLFELGFSWGISSKTTQYIAYEAIFMYSDMTLCYSHYGKDYFNKQHFKEITLKDLGLDVNGDILTQTKKYNLKYNIGDIVKHNNFGDCKIVGYANHPLLPYVVHFLNKESQNHGASLLGCMVEDEYGNDISHTMPESGLFWTCDEYLTPVSTESEVKYTHINQLKVYDRVSFYGTELIYAGINKHGDYVFEVIDNDGGVVIREGSIPSKYIPSGTNKYWYLTPEKQVILVEHGKEQNMHWPSDKSLLLDSLSIYESDKKICCSGSETVTYLIGIDPCKPEENNKHQEINIIKTKKIPRLISLD